MRIAILQSCYIPWKGYFDIIGAVDLFVVYDDVQFRKNHWHNRNRIKTSQGAQWLTIPVSSSSTTLIEDVRISAPFAERHWRGICQNYSSTPFFPEYRERFSALYERLSRFDRLSQVNLLLLEGLCRELSIDTPLCNSSRFSAQGRRTERLVNICREAGATHYLSGPAAKSYLEEDKFREAGIAVEWMDYSNYPEYPQLYGSFIHELSVIDLLFNTGRSARNYMKSSSKST